jgi:hypothetical protein
MRSEDVVHVVYLEELPDDLGTERVTGTPVEKSPCQWR